MQVGIIGCGIAGAYLAWKLSKKHNITVLEQKKTIGKEACSGLVSERLWNFIPKNEKIVQNKLDSVIINFPKKRVKLNFLPHVLVANRKSLDKYVAGLAKKSGAKIILNTKVMGIEKEKEKITVKTNKKLYEFDYLIGCDGPLSPARKFLNLKEPKFRLGIFFHDKKSNSSHTAVTYASKNGFCWIIPRGSCTEYGAIESPDIVKKIFYDFCKKKKIKIKKMYSGLVPEGLTTSNSDKIALCGDSAGLTKPWSSGGVIWSLTAADVLVKNFPNIKKYNGQLRKFFEPRFFFSELLTKTSKKIAFSFPQVLPKEILFDSDWIY